MARSAIAVGVHVVLAAQVALATTVPAVSGSTQWQGRYIANADGSATFDWPGVRVRFRVQGTTTVAMALDAPGTTKGQIRVFVDGVNVTTVAVDSSSKTWPVVSGCVGTGEFSVAWWGGATSENGGADRTSARPPSQRFCHRFPSSCHRLSAAATHDIELYSVLEPALLHPQPFLPSAPYQALTLSSVTVDGTLAPPPPALTRTLVFVGDSITAGFGAGLESAQVRPGPAVARPAHSTPH